MFPAGSCLRAEKSIPSCSHWHWRRVSHCWNPLERGDCFGDGKEGAGEESEAIDWGRAKGAGNRKKGSVRRSPQAMQFHSPAPFYFFSKPFPNSYHIALGLPTPVGEQNCSFPVFKGRWDFFYKRQHVLRHDQKRGRSSTETLFIMKLNINFN